MLTMPTVGNALHVRQETVSKSTDRVAKHKLISLSRAYRGLGHETKHKLSLRNDKATYNV